VKLEVVPVTIRGLIPSPTGCALFIGNEQKTFVIQVEHAMGAVIGMALRGVRHERPLTHDLVTRILQGFNIAIERVIITELRDTTFFARLMLRQHLEGDSNLVEIDARPSDCLALAVLQKKPIFVTQKLFGQVEDMSEMLSHLSDESGETGELGESEPT
jgi:uncharacterized protein